MGFFASPAFLELLTGNGLAGYAIKCKPSALVAVTGFTLNTYTHATTQMKQAAADTIGEVINRAM